MENNDEEILQIIKNFFKDKCCDIISIQLLSTLSFTVFGVNSSNNYFVATGFYSAEFNYVSANFNVFRELTPENIKFSISKI